MIEQRVLFSAYQTLMHLSAAHAHDRTPLRVPCYRSRKRTEDILLVVSPSFGPLRINRLLRRKPRCREKEMR